MTNYDFIDDFIDTYKSYANDYEKGRYEMGWSSQQREYAISKAREYRQLAEWLEELKAYQQLDLDIPQHFTKEQSDWIKKYCINRNKEFYNKAIDDFAEILLKHKSKDDYPIMCFDEETIKKFAEKLKDGGKNE